MTDIIDQKWAAFNATMAAIALRLEWSYDMFTRHNLAAMRYDMSDNAFLARIHRECAIDSYADILALRALRKDMNAMWGAIVLH